MRGHYEQLLRVENLVISVCGDFPREQLIDWLNAGLNSLSDQAFKALAVDAFSRPKAAKQLELRMDREQAVVFQAFPDVGILDEDYVVGEMMNELFSGMSSRLFERVREDKGMAYYVGSTRVLGLQSSMFVLYAGTHPDMVEEVLKEMNGEIARVIAGDVLEDELTRCRTRLKAARPMGRQTLGARAMHAAIQHSYGQTLDDDAEHAARVDAVDAQALAAFASRYLVGDRRVQLVVQPDGDPVKGLRLCQLSQKKPNCSSNTAIGKCV